MITQVPGGARVQVAAAPAPLGAVGAMGAAPQAQPQGYAPAPQMAMGQPQPQPPAAPQFQAPPVQPQPQAAPGADRAQAAQLLAEILQKNPATKAQFNVELFRVAMTNEPLRNLIASPQFQTEVMGQPLNLP